MYDFSKKHGQLEIPHLFNIQGSFATIMCDPIEPLKVGDTFVESAQSAGYYTIDSVIGAREARGVWKNYKCHPVRIDCKVSFKEATLKEMAALKSAQ